MALFGMTFIVQAVKVPTGSMQNTITIGDHLLVNKFIFAPGASAPFLPQREIKRGDVIVFKYPGNRYDPRRDERPDNRPITTNYVKRVIGLPGDRVRMEGKNVIVNGKPLPEHQIEAIDNNDKAPLKIVNNPPRKPGELYDVYYNPDFVEEDYPIFKFEGDGREVVIRKASISSWATTATIAKTAAIGALCRGNWSSAAPCLSIGLTTKARLTAATQPSTFW